MIKDERISVLFSETDLEFENSVAFRPLSVYDGNNAQISGCAVSYINYPSILWRNNDVCFPRKITGIQVFLHRIKPGIQDVSIDKMKELAKQFRRKYFLDRQDHLFLVPVHAHEVMYVGNSPHPTQTGNGYLQRHHGNEITERRLEHTTYGEVVLEIKNPLKERSCHITHCFQLNTSGN